MATELPLPVNSLCADKGPTFMEDYFLSKTIFYALES